MAFGFDHKDVKNAFGMEFQLFCSICSCAAYIISSTKFTSLFLHDLTNEISTIVEICGPSSLHKIQYLTKIEGDGRVVEGVQFEPEFGKTNRAFEHSP